MHKTKLGIKTHITNAVCYLKKKPWERVIEDSIDAYLERSDKEREAVSKFRDKELWSILSKAFKAQTYIVVDDLGRTKLKVLAKEARRRSKVFKTCRFGNKLMVGRRITLSDRVKFIIDAATRGLSI